MKKIFFTLLTIAVSFQGYSQTMNDNFQSLSMDFDAMRSQSQYLGNSFNELNFYSQWNAGEHYNMGQSNLGNNWNSIRVKFEEISYLFDNLTSIFDSAFLHMQQTADNFAVFNGSYSSLSGLPTLFDGNFSSLSGTPTTLAGYGITDGFSGNYSDLSGKPSFRDLSSSNPVVFGSLDAFGGTFTNRATIDVIADSNGDLITGYKNGASADRFNVKLDTADESAIVSSGGGYELKLYSESGEMTFEGMDMFNPVLFTFNGETEMNGNTVIEGTATADLFIGDGGGLTNLPTPSITFNDLTTKPTTIAGYGITDAFDGSYNNLTNKPFEFYSTNNSGIQSPSNVASASYAVAVGDNNTAQGPASIAMGKSTRATGEAATSAGFNTAAEGDYSFAIGRNSIALDDSSVAAGFSSEAQGANSIAMGTSARATRNFSTAIGYEAHATGLYSTAMGSLSTASGPYSTVTGYMTEASGDFAVAMGYQTKAIGSHTTAIGSRSTASGMYSTAMGVETTASDYNSMVLGQWNLAGSTVTSEAMQYSLDNTALVIGNGADSENRSDALVVKFNGDATLAGSMTATSFIGDGSQLTNLPSSGSDSPFSYNSNEAGGIEIADYTSASGSRAFAVGNDNLASGSSSTAMGRGTIASGNDSTALGANTEASGDASSALGERTTASGNYSTAMGYYTTASGDFSTASGEGTTASGMVSTAMGAGTTANGMFSTAMGYGTRASDRSSLIIGQYNLLGSTVTNSATDFSLENTAFVIGNGTNSANRSDALEVKFNGDATLAGNLNINSDARLKSNIISLGSTLSKLLQIDGKSYTMKKDENKKQKIGLLAQDIEKVFPELVSESHGVKSVNYQGLVPILINALKEQDEKMKSQQSQIDELRALVQNLIN